MGEKNIWNFLGSLFSSMFGFGSNIFTNMMNKRYQDEANKTNLEIARQTNKANMQMTNATNLANRELVREQNAAASAEAEKAYQRSKPTTQVANMQAAGMSLAGAINSLNGGGSYSPAPVNVSSDEASRNQSAQVSPAQLMSSEGVFANIANAFMQREQIKSSERIHRDNLKQQAQEAEKQRKHELLLSDINSGNQVQHDYLEYEKHKDRLKFDYANARRNWRIIDKQVAHLEKQTDYIDVQIKGAELDNLRKQLENANYPTLAKLANEKMQTEINSLILSYNQAVENHTLDKERKELENKWIKMTQESGIKAENIRNELEAYMDTVHLSANSPAGGLLACLELFVNNYLPTLARVK